MRFASSIIYNWTKDTRERERERERKSRHSWCFLHKHLWSKSSSVIEWPFLATPDQLLCVQINHKNYITTLQPIRLCTFSFLLARVVVWCTIYPSRRFIPRLYKQMHLSLSLSLSPSASPLCCTHLQRTFLPQVFLFFPCTWVNAFSLFFPLSPTNLDQRTIFPRRPPINYELMKTTTFCPRIITATSIEHRPGTWPLLTRIKSALNNWQQKYINISCQREFYKQIFIRNFLQPK